MSRPEGLQDPFGEQLRRLTWALGLLGAVAGLAATWNALDWWRPVSAWELEAVGEQVTRQIAQQEATLNVKLERLADSILNNKRSLLEERWSRRTREIDELELRLEEQPRNGDLRRMLNQAKRDRDRVDAEIRRMEESSW